MNKTSIHIEHQKKQRKIYTQAQKDQIRNNLEKILTYYGAKEGKYNWQCIPYRHNKPDNDLSINGNVCCCHCGIKGDAFNVIAELEGYDIKKDFTLIIEKGIEIVGCENPTINYTYKTNGNKSNKNNESTKEKEFKNVDHNLTSIILQYFSLSKKYYYFYRRNIKNDKLLKRYKVICEDPRKIFPKELLPQVYNLWSYQNIIPVWEDKKVVNVILRRDDYLNKKNKKTLNLKNIPLKIWNAGYIRHSQKNDMLFITEGIFDALSLECIDCKGIALNSITMINKFLDIIKEFIDQLKENQVKFFICFDNDPRNPLKPNKKMPSEIAREQLDKELRTLGLKSVILKLNKYKDVNEFYMDNSFTFKEEIYKAIKFIESGDN
jgi:hypothetical protein